MNGKNDHRDTNAKRLKQTMGYLIIMNRQEHPCMGHYYHVSELQVKQPKFCTHLATC